MSVFLLFVVLACSVTPAVVYVVGVFTHHRVLVTLYISESLCEQCFNPRPLKVKKNSEEGSCALQRACFSLNFWCVCVCVRACVRACVRVCVCVG